MPKALNPNLSLSGEALKSPDAIWEELVTDSRGHTFTLVAQLLWKSATQTSLGLQEPRATFLEKLDHLLVANYGDLSPAHFIGCFLRYLHYLQSDDKEKIFNCENEVRNALDRIKWIEFPAKCWPSPRT